MISESKSLGLNSKNGIQVIQIINPGDPERNAFLSNESLEIVGKDGEESFRVERKADLFKEGSYWVLRGDVQSIEEWCLNSFSEWSGKFPSSEWGDVFDHEKRQKKLQKEAFESLIESSVISLPQILIVFGHLDKALRDNKSFFLGEFGEIQIERRPLRPAL